MRDPVATLGGVETLDVGGQRNQTSFVTPSSVEDEKLWCRCLVLRPRRLALFQRMRPAALWSRRQPTTAALATSCADTLRRVDEVPAAPVIFTTSIRV